MAIKEVYSEAKVVDNENHEVSQTAGETQDTISKQKVKLKLKENQWYLAIFQD